MDRGGSAAGHRDTEILHFRKSGDRQVFIVGVQLQRKNGGGIHTHTWCCSGGAPSVSVSAISEHV